MTETPAPVYYLDDGSTLFVVYKGKLVVSTMYDARNYFMEDSPHGLFNEFDGIVGSIFEHFAPGTQALTASCWNWEQDIHYDDSQDVAGDEEFEEWLKTDAAKDALASAGPITWGASEVLSAEQKVALKAFLVAFPHLTTVQVARAIKASLTDVDAVARELAREGA